MPPRPETSVVLPVRDGSAYVAEAVLSVLRQLDPDDELLVVDDASRDNTRAVLRGIGDERMVVLDGAGAGVSAARNRGLAAARGEFLAFLDHDDLWPDGRHEALRKVMRADADLGACYGRVRIRLEQGAVHEGIARTLDGRHIQALIGSALYRRTHVRRTGGFAEDMRLREDADFTARFLEQGERFELLAADGLIYRRHASNVTNDQQALTLALLDVARRRLRRRGD